MFARTDDHYNCRSWSFHLSDLKRQRFENWKTESDHNVSYWLHMNMIGFTHPPIQLLQTMSRKQALFDHDFFFHCSHETSRPLFTSDMQYLGGRFQLDRPSSRSTSRRRLLAIFYWWCVRPDSESTGLTAGNWLVTILGRANGKYQIAPPNRWWCRQLCRRLTTRSQKAEPVFTTTQQAPTKWFLLSPRSWKA